MNHENSYFWSLLLSGYAGCRKVIAKKLILSVEKENKSSEDEDYAAGSTYVWFLIVSCLLIPIAVWEGDY